MCIQILNPLLEKNSSLRLYGKRSIFFAGSLQPSWLSNLSVFLFIDEIVAGNDAFFLDDVIPVAWWTVVVEHESIR